MIVITILTESIMYLVCKIWGRGGGGEVIKVHYGLGENSELFIVVEAQPRPQ